MALKRVVACCIRESLGLSLVVGERFISWSVGVSQWPEWLGCQCGELEICGLSPGYDTNFSLKNYYLYVHLGGLVAQAVRRSPPTAGVPSSRLGHSMWVSWWTKRGLGGFFTGFLPFSPTTNFIPPFLHTHLIHFVSFHPPLWWCVRRGRPAPLLLTDL